MDRLKGKRVLFIGAQDARKNYAWDILGQHGVHCCVVGTVARESIQGRVDKYVLYDSTRHEHDHQHCDVIAGRVTSEYDDVDGCMTLWDDSIPLTALLCARLGKPGVPYSGARAAKQKSRTFQTLADAATQEDGATTAVGQYLSRCCAVSSLEELERSSQIVGFPAILKTDYGGGGLGARLVLDLEDSQRHWRAILAARAAMPPERTLYMDAGFDSQAWILMEFLRGTEHCVDLVAFRGELLLAVVTDKGPQDPPDVFHAVSVMPSLLGEELRGKVVQAAWRCCQALGLTHGVFDVDVMLTSSGPKLLEVNARVPGLCQRDFMLHCYGLDILVIACMLACDIKPEFSHVFSCSARRVTTMSFPCTAASSGVSSSAVSVTGSVVTTSLTPPKTADIEHDQNIQNGTEAHTVSNNDTHSSEFFQRGVVVPRPSCYIVGMALYPHTHGAALRSTARPETLEGLHEEGELLFFRHERALLTGQGGGATVLHAGGQGRVFRRCRTQADRSLSAPRAPRNACTYY